MLWIIRVASAGLFALTADVTAAQTPSPCAATDVEYALSGTLRLAETPLGKGDGAYKIGPGSMVLRYSGGRVVMRSYAMRELFTISMTAFFSTMTIVTDSRTNATPDSCGVAAEGVSTRSGVQWTTAVRGIRTEGTVTCTGRYCGTMGAPDTGTTGLHLPPHDSTFKPFEFRKDGSFTMPFTLAAKTEEPKQTSYVALTGREVKRTCVPAPPPCKKN